MSRAVTALGACFVLTACGFVGGTPPDGVCREQAQAHGGDFRVAGAFATTIGDVRGLSPNAPPAPWAELPDDARAVVCYLDGAVPKAPPGGVPFNRAVVVIVGDRAETVIAGYRDQLPIEEP